MPKRNRKRPRGQEIARERRVLATDTEYATLLEKAEEAGNLSFSLYMLLAGLGAEHVEAPEPEWLPMARELRAAHPRMPLRELAAMLAPSHETVRQWLKRTRNAQEKETSEEA